MFAWAGWAILRPFLPYIAGALLAAGIVGGFAVHERNAQKAKDAKVLAVVQARLTAADARSEQYSKAFADMTAATVQAKAAQDAQVAAGRVAVAQAEKSRADAQRSLGQWKRNYQVLLNNPRVAAQLAGAECSLPDGNY